MQLPSRRQALVVASFGVLLAAVPFVLGIVLGFLNFVVTPILVPALAVVCGTSVYRTAPRARWTATLLCSFVAAASYCGLFAVLIVGTSLMNGEAIAPIATPQSALVFVGAFAGFALFIALGVLFAGWRARRADRAAANVFN